MSRGWVWAIVALQAGIVAADSLTGASVVFTTAYVVPVLLLALIAGPRPVIAVALVAVGLALLSGVVDSNFAGRGHLARVAIVGAGGLAAVAATFGRIRLQREVQRLTLLARTGDIVTGGHGFEQAIVRLLDLLVPALADQAVVDVLEPDGSLRRVAVRLRPGLVGDPAVERELLARPVSATAIGTTARGANPRLVRVTEEMLRAAATDPADLKLLRALGLRSALSVPLQAGGCRVGILGLGRAGGRRRFTRADVAFVAVVAGRAALALENSRLLDETRRTERELSGILEGITDAVHVHDATGRTVYANTAAAALLRLPSPDEVLEASPGQLAGRFEITAEDGAPISVEDLPGRRLFAGEREPPPMLARSVDRAAGTEMWSLTKSSAVLGDDGEPVLAVNVIEDVTAAKQRELATRMLDQAGEVLAATLDLDTTLSRVAGLAVPWLADWCGVDLPGSVYVEQSAIAHVEPAMLAVGTELRRRYPVSMNEPAGLAAVLRGAPTFRLEGIADADLELYARDAEHLRLLRTVGFRHLVVVGMRVAGDTIGALTFVRAPGRAGFTDSEVALAEELARRAGTAVLNARLYTARSEVAETLQRSLLPPRLPTVPGLAMHAHYRPAGEVNRVGGDFYDAYALGDGWLVAIGDVTGKGAEAAALTGLARSAFEAVATLTGSPALALSHLNGLLARRGELALCSVACLHLRMVGGAPHADVLCAGHPPPLLLRSGAVTALGHPGPLVGAFGGEAWNADDVTLGVGDVIVLRTDGVTDTVGADGRLGEERLRAALDGAAPGDAPGALARVRDAVAQHQVGPQRDDVAIVVIAVTGAVGAPPSGPEAAVLPASAAHVVLDGTPASVRRARGVVDEQVAGRLPDGRLAEIRLLVSELASNAVKHAGGGTYDLALDLDHRRLRVEVADRGPGFSAGAQALADEPGEGGYGLGIVERLAERWGVERGGDPPGTRVWFEIDRGR